MRVEQILGGYLHRAFRTHMRLDPQSCSAWLEKGNAQASLLYVHIPYCEHLCPFCSFHRVRLDREEARRYFDALRSEIRTLADHGFVFTECYVGGGTPTVMPGELARTLELLRTLFPVGRISVETNPNHLNREVLPLLRDSGVDRLSVGIQSFDDRLLKEMDRYDAYGSGARHIERLGYAQGIFDTLNADMIFNLPHQTGESLRRDIRLLSEEIGVDQVSFYPLMNSTTTARAMEQRMGKPGYDKEKPFYELIREGMQARYRSTSAWCFSRKEGMIDEYIIDHGDVAAAGSGTFSYLDGTLYSSTFSINRYIGQIENGHSPVSASRHLQRKEQLHYALLMRLFGLHMDKAAMRRRFGAGVFRELEPELLLLRSLGLVREDSDSYRLTRRGLYPWVVMMREFFIGVNNVRDQMRLHIREEWGMEACPAGSGAAAGPGDQD